VSGQTNEIAVSPDGSAVAYDAETYVYGTDPHVTADVVHVMRADGTDNHAVYRCPVSSCSSLQWSPVGDRLLMNGNALLQPDGKVVRLCQGGCDSGDRLESANWSPDGRRLVFEGSVTVRLQGGTSTVSAIGIADADGSHVQLITNRKCTAASKSACTYDSSPVWSPNGQSIAFVRLIPTFLRLDQSMGLGPIGPTGVYTVHPNGSSVTKLGGCGIQCRITSLQWEADGNRLAYVGTPNSITNNTATNMIDIANTTSGSTNVLRLRTHTSQPEEEWIAPAIAWAPSGQQVAVVAHQLGKPTALYTVAVHGITPGALSLVRSGAFPPVAWIPSVRWRSSFTASHAVPH
jgi:Tol biopolymer transport system component